MRIQYFIVCQIKRFYVIAFILYFPSADSYWIWLPSHGNMLLITVIFMWCAIGICIILFLQSIIIWFFYKRNSNDDLLFVQISDNEESN